MNKYSGAIQDRINEAQWVCNCDTPIHSQISEYGLSLYILGLLDTPDIVSVDDYDMGMASEILRDRFLEVDETDIPQDYSAAESPDKYLMVMGDPSFPTHFAAVVDKSDSKPFFSKLRYQGSSYNSLEDIQQSFSYERDFDNLDIHYFKAV